MFDLRKFEDTAKSYEELLETVKRNKRSVTGRGYYGKKSRRLGAALKREIVAAAGILRQRARPDLAEDIERYGNLFVERDLSTDERLELMDELQVQWDSEFKPILEREVKAALGEVFPADLFAALHSNFRVVASELNECWGRELWNASLLLVRRLSETLIIEWYEANNRVTQITDGQGRYLGFGDLIGKVRSGQALRVSTTSQAALDSVKTLADNAAHNRYFRARGSDLEGMRDKLRVLFDELCQKLSK
jgi:hypothetical protein